MNTILTDDELEDAWCKYGDEMGGADQSDALRIGREIEAAVLAKLQEQEPVAYGMPDTQLGRKHRLMMVRLDKGQDGCTLPLYAAPLPAVVQVPQAVAYLDIGAGGYLDLGSDLTDEQLQELPKGRHMLAIVGTFGVDGYTPAAPEAPAQDNYKAWYEEAIEASNEAGFAGASAADVIRELVRMLGAFEATARPDSGWRVVVLDTIRSADKGRSEPHHDLIWIPSGCSLAIITHVPEEKR